MNVQSDCVCSTRDSGASLSLHANEHRTGGTERESGGSGVSRGLGLAGSGLRVRRRVPWRLGAGHRVTSRQADRASSDSHSAPFDFPVRRRPPGQVHRWWPIAQKMRLGMGWCA